MNLKEIEQRYAKGYDNTVAGMIQMQNDMEWLLEQAEKLDKIDQLSDPTLWGWQDTELFRQILGR